VKFFLSSPATEWRPKVAHGETVGYVAKAPKRGERNVWRSIFCRPIRGLKFFFAIQPTVSPWATFCRASGASAAMILLFAVCATAETTNDLSDAKIQGFQLAQQLCEARPTESLTNAGVMTIRDAKGNRMEFSLTYKIITAPTNWMSIYETAKTNSNGFASGTRLKIVHADNQPDDYTWNNSYSVDSAPVASGMGEVKWSGTQWTHPFPSGDFWAVDLGLEFFHWPEQKILKSEMRRGRPCKVLESTNPNPSPNGYSRVVSWIDNESGGIVHAEACDANGRLLKAFDPKSFKKVNGQWELQDMEIRNVQTGSRTRLEFDLKAH